MKKNEKSLTMPKKTERGTLWSFSTSILSQKLKKNEGRPLEKKIPQKKSRNAEKTERGTLFGLVRYFMLRGKPFWFSSLGQTGTIWRLLKIL